MRVNNGLTPQELEAYGISDVHDIVYNPSYDLLYQEELDPSLTGYERGVLTATRLIDLRIWRNSYLTKNSVIPVTKRLLLSQK